MSQQDHGEIQITYSILVGAENQSSHQILPYQHMDPQDIQITDVVMLKCHNSRLFPSGR
jgi:hypothetical protein